MTANFIKIAKGISNLDCFRHGQTTVDNVLRNEPPRKASLGIYLVTCECPAMPSSTVRPI